jgi:hypothetical protein
LGVKVLQEYTRKIFFIHDIYVHTGYHSPLLQMDPELVYSADVVYVVSPRLSFSLGLESLFSLGGNIEETPCVDSFDREYHCGTGLPWSDSHRYHLENASVRETSISVSLRF